MDILKKINALRRVLMAALTNRVGRSNKGQKIDALAKTKIKRILICRPNNRLGNLLLITPLVQELVLLFPNCEIDLIVKGDLASIIFKNYPNINKIRQLPRKPFKHLINYLSVWFSVKNKKYDLAINAVSGSSSGKLLTAFSRSTYKLFGDSNQHHIAKEGVFDLRRIINDSEIKSNDVPLLDLKLDAIEISNGLQALKKLAPNNNKTICLFTYATGEKCYSEAWWNSFYLNLKQKFVDYNIIEVLPIENISKIGFKEPSFYSSNIRDIASLIANTTLFIGADSGIMHLAVSSQATTVGLFSVTQQKKYEPYGNYNTAINTNTTSVIKSMDIINDILNKKTIVLNA